MFIAVGVDGQFLFKFRIQDREDFINTEDLVLFRLCEEAGNILPTFELSFLTMEESILGLFHEGNDIQVSFGQDKGSMVDIKLVPMRVTPTRSGENRRMITANGFFSALAYLNTDKVSITDKMSGVEAVKLIASKHFDTKNAFNITKSTDTQNWVQAAIPDRQFINNIWMRINLPNSFPAVGISSDGKFILKDIKEELKKEYKWKFTSKPVGSKDIFFNGDYLPDITSGFINNWVGYTREKTQYNIETGDEQIVSNTVKPVMSLTKEVAKRVDIEKRYAQAGVISDNVHTEYNSAYLRNLSSLASMGAVKNVVSFQDIYKPIRVLDLVMFKEDSLDQPNTGTGGFTSGLHFVSKLSRTVQNSKLTTVVEIARESINELRADFLTKPAPPPPPPVVEKTPTQTLLEELKSRFPGKF